MVVEEEVGEEVEEVGKREVTISTRFFTKPGNCTKPRFSRFKDGRRTGEGRTNGGRTDGRTERRADGRKDGRTDGRRTGGEAREKGGGRQGREGGSKPGRERERWMVRFSFFDKDKKRGRIWNQRKI